MKRCSKCGVSKPTTEFHTHRKTVDGLYCQCKECTRAAVNAYANANRVKVRESNRTAGTKFRESHLEAERARVLAIYHSKPLEVRTKCSVEWRLNNPHKRAASESKRRAGKHQATPVWANQKYVDLFYKIAAEEAVRIGEAVHVDHIVPLKSRSVCGLHCEFNLQLLRASENLSKSNRHWPGMPT